MKTGAKGLINEMVPEPAPQGGNPDVVNVPLTKVELAALISALRDYQSPVQTYALDSAMEVLARCADDAGIKYPNES